MNIHTSYWRDLEYSRDELKDPRNNIEAGVRIIKGIRDRVQPLTIEGTASLCVNLAVDEVSDYGARVAEIYRNKPWDYYIHPPATVWGAMTDKNYLRDLFKEIN